MSESAELLTAGCASLYTASAADGMGDPERVLFAAEVRQAVHPDAVCSVEDDLTEEALSAMQWQGKDVRFEHGFPTPSAPVSVGKTFAQYYVPETKKLYLFADIDKPGLPAAYLRERMLAGDYMETSLGHLTGGSLSVDGQGKVKARVTHEPVEFSVVDESRMRKDYGEATDIFATLTGAELAAYQKRPAFRAVLDKLYKTPAFSGQGKHLVTASATQPSLVTVTCTSERTTAMADQKEEPVATELSEQAVQNVVEGKKRAAPEDAPAAEAGAKKPKGPGMPKEMQALFMTVVTESKKHEQMAKETADQLVALQKQKADDEKELAALRKKGEADAEEIKHIKVKNQERLSTLMNTFMGLAAEQDKSRVKAMTEDVMTNRPEAVNVMADFAEMAVKASALAEERVREDLTSRMGMQLREWGVGAPAQVPSAREQLEKAALQYGVQAEVPPPSKTASHSVVQGSTPEDPIADYVASVMQVGADYEDGF